MSKVANQLPDGGQDGERRAALRTATMFRPVLVEVEGTASFFLIRNLSPSGMQGKAYTQFSEGLPIAVHLNSEHVISGAIVWFKDQSVGIQFDELIDVSSTLEALAKASIGGKVNRAPRLQINCDAELLIEDRTLQIELQDISQRGLKARASYVRPGDDVVIRLPGMEPRKAVVCWTGCGTAGLNFVNPLGFEEMAEWAIQIQSDSQ